MNKIIGATQAADNVGLSTKQTRLLVARYKDAHPFDEYPCKIGRNWIAPVKLWDTILKRTTERGRPRRALPLPESIPA